MKDIPNVCSSKGTITIAPDTLFLSLESPRREIRSNCRKWTFQMVGPAPYVCRGQIHPEKATERRGEGLTLLFVYPLFETHCEEDDPHDHQRNHSPKRDLASVKTNQIK
jgi:hypothetical protein